MSTTVHIPEKLLRSVDARAKHLKISRNKFVLKALERALSDRSEWSPKFLASVQEPVEGAELLDDVLRHIVSSRRSKKAPVL